MIDPSVASAVSAAVHTCHALGCTVPVPPEMLACKSHWFSLPAPLRKAVLQTYRPGQCRDMRPSAAYCTAAADAIEHIARREGVGEELIARMRSAYNALGSLRERAIRAGTITEAPP